MTAKVLSLPRISRGGQAKGKSSAEGGLEWASESHGREPTRDLAAPAMAIGSNPLSSTSPSGRVPAPEVKGSNPLSPLWPQSTTPRAFADPETSATIWAWSPGGIIRPLDMEDVNGRLVSLHMPLKCLNRLIMTLPEMVRRALQAQHCDASLRIVYPVSRFKLELAGDSETRILTLETPDGFSASFGLTEEQCRDRELRSTRKLRAN
jgi:hypothetical protein